MTSSNTKKLTTKIGQTCYIILTTENAQLEKELTGLRGKTEENKNAGHQDNEDEQNVDLT